MFFKSIVGALSVIAPFALAVPSTPDKRQDCEFHPRKNPTCWKGTYNLQTNYYKEAPPGQIREYTFELKNITISPDGFDRTVLAINGAIPGPTIFAEWGDTVSM
jgi:FtsP/CotA-like multicopper oxidase with cupredoxin domain